MSTVVVFEYDVVTSVSSFVVVMAVVDSVDFVGRASLVNVGVRVAAWVLLMVMGASVS